MIGIFCFAAWIRRENLELRSDEEENQETMERNDRLNPKEYSELKKYELRVVSEVQTEVTRQNPKEYAELKECELRVVSEAQSEIEVCKEGSALGTGLTARIAVS